MKLLAKKSIDSAKATERKKEIDSGLALARKVDTLREARATEEENLKNYRLTALAQVQYEIGQFIETKNNLEKQCNEARDLRKELLKPLDEEWFKINLAIEKLKKDTESSRYEADVLKSDRKAITIKESKLSKLVTQSKSNENETRKAKINALRLEELAKSEYEIAKEEHARQTKTYEKKLSDLRELQTSYEVGIKTNEHKEKILEEEKSDLITRAKELARQLKLVQSAWQEIKKHEH